MKINIWTIGLVLAACVGIGIVAYERGQANDSAASAGPLTSLQLWINQNL
jgi:hypothetical protein